MGANQLIEFHTHRKKLIRRFARRAGAFAVVSLCLYSVVNAAFDPAPSITPSAQTAFVAPQPNAINPRVSAAVPAAKIAATSETSISPTLVSSIEQNISNYLDSGPVAKKVTIGKGDTLMDLLTRKAALPRDQAVQVIAALKKVYNPRDLNPGHTITVFFHKSPSVADPKFSGLRIERDIINSVTVNREDNGKYTVNKEEKDVQRHLRGFKGTISSSLYEDAKASGIPDSVILELIKMYSWNVDFQRGIHDGDKFEVMYEEYKTEDNKIVHGRGNILYAKLTLDGDDMPFYRYTEKTGDVGYYDNNGRSARKPLMRTPIDGARLSSGFGMRRHPVLGYSKMHKGVDFAAPRGTPIYAAGDGTIEKIGPFSSFGNYIRIRHNNGLKTAYAHMRGFKSGLRGGSRVKQGEVIGYVGTTGRSTGPHLHYEVMVNNSQVNPNSVKLPTGNTLKGRELKNFKSLLALTHEKFNSLSHASAVAMASSGR